jgi:sugar phosphate isomerase/epimerase
MRNWVTGIAVVCALAFSTMAFGQQNREAQEKLGWRLGCQAYTFGRTGVTLYDTIAILKELKIGYVELYPGQVIVKGGDVKVGPDMPADWLAELQIVLKEANVKAVAYGVTGVPNDEAGARKLFEWAKKLGIETIVSEPGANQFALLDKLAKEYDIKVALHNHPKPSPYWDPNVVIERSKDASKLIGACADTGHWARSGLVPVDCIKKLEGRIVEFHFKDLNQMGNGHDVPWGTGVCDLKAMLKEIKRQNFKGVFSIEYEHGSGAELTENVGKCVVNFAAAAEELAKE